MNVMQDRNGFTLVELMITIFVASLLTVAFYSTYVMQRKSHTSQGQVVEMQQNLRAAVETMTREMRMAGYDPNETALTGTNTAIRVATPTLITFFGDLDEEGDYGSFLPVPPPPTVPPPPVNEFFSYSHNAGTLTLDRDVAVDAAALGGSQDPVAENIERLEFTYILDNGDLVANPSAAEILTIRSVRVSLLARSRLQDNSYVNEETYTSASGNVFYGPPSYLGGVCTNCDNFRRRLMITQIDLRNMGLED